MLSLNSTTKSRDDNEEEIENDEYGDEFNDEYDVDLNLLEENNSSESTTTGEQAQATTIIDKGSTFVNYKEFRDQLKVYSKETSQLFVITNSVKTKPSDNEYDTNSYPYKTQIFRCIRHRKPNESTSKSNSGCVAYIRLNLQQRGKTKGLYKITAMHAEHNHDHLVTPDAFKRHYAKIKETRLTDKLAGISMPKTPMQTNQKDDSFTTETLENTQDDSIWICDDFPAFNDVRSLITSENMCQSAKYVAALRDMQEIANNLKKLEQNEFEKQLAKLLKLSECVQNNTPFEIVTETDD